ncbi:MAG: ABC transporter ATP-binding protein [Lachnospiraceae bacterium]|nr:ABC transporter ATP-binding protein [Lachnospiraceae bacterium]
MIQVTNLTKVYGDHVALDHVSFSVEKGQVLGFLGPNGAGKSTTMNILTGYISATEGTVTIHGHDIFEEPEEAKKHIGYLPEIPPLYPEMRVSEYLRFAAELKQVERSKRGQMVSDIMESVGITDMAKRLIRHLSKGYRQRVGLAAAMMGYPEVIILDEPTVGLDPAQIIEIRDLIHKLSREHTIILSSHILSEVAAVCDHIIIINKGKLAASDTPENLERTMQSGNSLTMKVKGEGEKILSCLKALPGVRDVSVQETEEGLLAVRIGSDETTDVREAVFYALAESKNPIFEMNMSKLSLEDIFLEMTRDGGAERDTEPEGHMLSEGEEEPESDRRPETKEEEA